MSVCLFGYSEGTLRLSLLSVCLSVCMVCNQYDFPPFPQVSHIRVQTEYKASFLELTTTGGVGENRGPGEIVLLISFSILTKV